MKKLMTAVALTIALPAAAMAQTAATANPHAGHSTAASSGQAKPDCMAMNHAGAGMDHSKMKNMSGTNMAGMDHSKMNMQGMSMSGMDHSKMSGMNMAGMEHCNAKSANTADKAKPSPAPKR